jgi:acyl-CoA reductase-like NAD-dependent aldehyde dehydrogenase
MMCHVCGHENQSSLIEDRFIMSEKNILRVANPANGELIMELEFTSSTALHEAFDKASEAQKTWCKSSIDDRLDVLSKFAKLLSAQQDDLAKILSSEMGKPIQQSRAEIKGTDSRIQFFLEHCAEVLAEQLVLDDPENCLQEGITRDPLGVIANISAWNYPYLIGSNVFVPGLLTGNAILYKPSEYATLTGLEIARLFKEAGLPDGLFTTVVGNGEVGAQLFDLDIKGVFFTGSYQTGKKVAAAAAKKLIKVQLELGGKDPIYIADDGDHSVAAEAVAEGAFYNNGQSCCAVERIYVHESVYDDFVEEFCDQVKSYCIGDPSSDDTFIGPVARAAHIEYLETQAKDAEAKGAKAVLGTGRRLEREGHFFDPTVYTEVNHDMLLMKEESFGPIIGIQKVKTDAEAITLMKDSAYGLTAGVFCLAGARAEAILDPINCGSVYWNCCDRVSPRLPWSGRGQSGLGLTLSKEGLLAFTQPKAWHWRSLE